MLSTYRAAGLITAVLCLIGSAPAQDSELQRMLAHGQLADAKQLLHGELTTRPDNLTQAQLGIVHVLEAVQGLADDSHRYGLYAQRWMGAPLLRLPVKDNPTPEAMTYDDFRKMIDRFRQRLVEAEEMLAAVEANDQKWRIELGKVGIDLNADDEIGERENLYVIMRSIQQPWFGRNVNENLPATDLAIDYADIVWLQGYCNFLAATCDMVLAYDEREMFELTGHIAFRGAQTRHEFLRPQDNTRDWSPFADLIAAIHLFDFPVVEPERMKSAHAHLLKTINLSRKAWQAVLAETDDDKEWIAGPDQTVAIKSLGMSLNRQQAAEWPKVLDEAEAVLKGEKLLPLWRTPAPDQGINLRRVFHEPRNFDLVLWIQQSGVMPFVEQGDVTDAATWARFQRSFGGNLIGFSFWLN